MGDKTWTYYDCPKCGKTEGVEIYDASNSLIYVEKCRYCDYKVDKDYYETGPHTIMLLTPEEARVKGIVPYAEREYKDN